MQRRGIKLRAEERLICIIKIVIPGPTNVQYPLAIGTQREHDRTITTAASLVPYYSLFLSDVFFYQTKPDKSEL